MIDSLGDIVSDGADGEHGHVIAVMQLAACSHLDHFQGTAPVLQHPSATRISNHERPHARQLGRVHQTAQFVFVEWRADGQVRNGAQGSKVEGTMMRRTVLADETSTIQTEHHVQVQQCHIVDDVVEGPLCKGTIDITEGQQAVLGHTARECDGMSFGNADIEGALRHLLHHDVHRTACGHGWCHADDLGILLSQFQQGMAEHVLVFLRLLGVFVHDALASLWVELPWGMPRGDVLLGRGIAVTLLRVQMEQLRSFHILHLSEDAHQLLHVVAVEWAEIAYVHALEDVLLVRDGTLDGIREADDPLAAVVVEHTLTVKPSRGLEADGIIGLVGAQVEQILFHAAHGMVDRHIIVVEDDQQVVR